MPFTHIVFYQACDCGLWSDTITVPKKVAEKLTFNDRGWAPTKTVCPDCNKPVSYHFKEEKEY